MIGQSRDKAATSEMLLIGWCRQVEALERGYREICDRDLPNEKELTDPIVKRQRPLIKLISNTQATTVKGLAAKARVLVGWAPELLNADDSLDAGDWLNASLLRDLIEGM